MIWIVASEQQTKKDLIGLIRERRYDVEAIDCVTDVPKRAKFRPPGMLIIDCGVQESFDLVNQMRGDPFTRLVPLVMFTTSKEKYREKAMALGVDGFVVKRSLDWEELLEHIERLVGPPPGRN